ncbi:MAG: class I SAM-dependent methyltransferase [Patescibacteria group bacterium]|nr:class I SAM-dependent methyltransferase [Patescibacteria group bacterium]
MTEFENRLNQTSSERKELPQPGYIFVEIGPYASLSVPMAGSKKFEEGSFYIAVEKDHKIAKRTERDFKLEALQNFHVIPGDAGKMPFLGNHTVDEVFLGNVVGDPGVHNHIKIFEEIKRILKPGGKLVIKETTTPDTVNLHTIEYILKNEGFTIIKASRPTDGSWESDVNPYDILSAKNKSNLISDDYRKESYILFATLGLTAN